MLGKDSGQRDFFDMGVEDLVPENHILMQIERAIDFSFVQDAIKHVYSTGMGRPSYPPLVLFKMLLLEYFYNLSDVRVSQECRYNLLFRRFIGLAVRDKVPDDTTLVYFRKRLGQQQFELLFDKVVQQAKDRGLIGNDLKIIDGTVIEANICVFNGINILRQAREHIIRTIEKRNDTQSGLREKYLDKERIYSMPVSEQLKEEKEKTKQFIEEVKGRHGKPVEEKVNMLEDILGTEEGKLPAIKSFVDTDARAGHSSKKKGFVGYKATVSFDDDSQLITSCHVLSGNENEGKHEHFKELVERDEAKGIKHQAVAGDGAYDSLANRQASHQMGMKAYFPSKRPNRQLNEFIYDREKETLTCKAGSDAISRTQQGDGYLYIFSVEDCSNCNQKDNCPGKKNMDRARVFVSKDILEKLKDETEEKQSALLKRKRIEKKFGEGKKWHGLARARYWGKCKVGIQVLLTFTVINLKRIAKLAEESGRLEQLPAENC
ncbi:MAG TPA: IS1182 family transposase [Bacillota bacterium]|nr:IS1182 family transposase [Bacillota bacterium]